MERYSLIVESNPIKLKTSTTIILSINSKAINRPLVIYIIFHIRISGDNNESHFTRYGPIRILILLSTSINLMIIELGEFFFLNSVKEPSKNCVNGMF